MYLWQYNALESYGFDVCELYPDDVLDYDELQKWLYYSDPQYITHKGEAINRYRMCVKIKSEKELQNDSYLSSYIKTQYHFKFENGKYVSIN